MGLPVCVNFYAMVNSFNNHAYKHILCNNLYSTPVCVDVHMFMVKYIILKYIIHSQAGKGKEGRQKLIIMWEEWQPC